MKKIEANYATQYLLPPSIEDWIGADHPARFIRGIVSQLDPEELGIQVPRLRTGRPPYAERLLLRVWLYGYWKRIRSTRKLEEACQNDLGFIWLCGNQAPDHNTLWRFFKKNKKALKALFRQTVKLAMDLSLVGFVMQAVDGTKLQAACSGYGLYDESHLKKIFDRLEQTIENLEQALEETNQGVSHLASTLPKDLQDARQLREKVKEALEEVQSGETKHCHPSDSEARRMKCEGRNRFAQNAQAVVDESNHIIVAEEVTQDEGDRQQLAKMSEEAVANTGRVPDTLTADGGYYNASEIEKAEERVGNVLLPIPEGSKNRASNPYHTSCFAYDPEQNVVICPEGRALLFRRERIKNQRTGHRVREYRSSEVCKECAVRQKCTKDRHGRSIEIPKGYEAVQRLKRRLADPVNQEKLKRRGRTVELIFAWIKQMDGFRRWTYHGLENVKAQWSMLCAVWNLKRIYQTWVERQREGQQVILGLENAGLIRSWLRKVLYKLRKNERGSCLSGMVMG